MFVCFYFINNKFWIQKSNILQFIKKKLKNTYKISVVSVTFEAIDCCLAVLLTKIINIIKLINNLWILNCSMLFHSSLKALNSSFKLWVLIFMLSWFQACSIEKKSGDTTGHWKVLTSKNNVVVCLLINRWNVDCRVICYLLPICDFWFRGVCSVDCTHLFTIGSTLIKHTPIDWK